MQQFEITFPNANNMSKLTLKTALSFIDSEMYIIEIVEDDTDWSCVKRHDLIEIDGCKLCYFGYLTGDSGVTVQIDKSVESYITFDKKRCRPCTKM